MSYKIVDENSIISLADAIRLKGGTSASLVFPSGFVSAIEDISGGGGGYTADEIALQAISGSISGSANCIGSYAFAYCSNLGTASFPSCTTIGNNAFANCYNLLSLYLLGSSRAWLINQNAFVSTPISNYTTSTGGIYGSIFVPASLYDSYISAMNWSVYSARIVSLTDAEITALER